MDLEEKYNIWNEQLRRKYESIWPDATYHIWDGVISPLDYANASVKIMFLNKEAYDDDSYDISGALKEQLTKREPIFCNYPIRWNIKNRLSVLAKLDTDISSLNDNDFISYSEGDFYSDMLKVAYCNIKKSNGVGKSNVNNLKESFIKNKDIIEEQISFFNPTVIVGGNIVDGIMDNNIEWGEDLYKSGSKYINVYQIKVRGILYPFLDMYHPARSISHQIDRTELHQALVAVDTKNPGYWINRCGKSCFAYSFEKE